MHIRALIASVVNVLTAVIGFFSFRLVANWDNIHWLMDHTRMDMVSAGSTVTVASMMLVIMVAALWLYVIRRLLS